MKKCPICSKPAVDAHKPFCSPRCADVDLHRWMGETYRVPVQSDDEEEDGTSLADSGLESMKNLH